MIPGLGKKGVSVVEAEIESRARPAAGNTRHRIKLARQLPWTIGFALALITAAVHPGVGLWNPEWTSHAQFIEKIKTRLNLHVSTPSEGRSAFASEWLGPHRQRGRSYPPAFRASSSPLL